MRANFPVRVALLLVLVSLLAVAMVSHAAPEGSGAASDGLPLYSFETDNFSGSGVCASCHNWLADSSGTNVSIATHRRSTMMANGAIDPLWQAKISSEIARNPALEGLIEEKCAVCHVPIAYTEMEVTGETVTLLGNGLLNPSNPLHEAAMESISCTLCHQVDGRNLGTAESFSGNFVIDTSTAPPDRLIYGPYTEPVSQQMSTDTGFTPVYSAHIEDPGLCATCHNLLTPYVLAGTATLAGDLFPEQMVYAEWEHGAYGDGSGDDDITCQQCHMPVAAGGVVISNRPAALAAREPFYQHHFAGGNVTLLQILRDNLDTLGVRASTEEMEATLARVVERLQEQTATVQVTGATWDGSTLQFDVDVTALAGHKVPTGYPWRRAWLHAVVQNGEGEILFESGGPGSDGAITGCDADVDGATYEPHYDVITQEDQVQIYETILEDSDAQVTYTLLMAAGYVKDNRLLPAGFDKASAGEEFAVYGEAAQDDDFVGGQDRVTYQIALPAEPARVTVSLLYQPLAFAFIDDLLESNTALVNEFEGYYNAVDKSPVVIDSTTVALNGTDSAVFLPLLTAD